MARRPPKSDPPVPLAHLARVAHAALGIDMTAWMAERHRTYEGQAPGSGGRVANAPSDPVRTAIVAGVEQMAGVILAILRKRLAHAAMDGRIDRGVLPHLLEEIEQEAAGELRGWLIGGRDAREVA